MQDNVKNALNNAIMNYLETGYNIDNIKQNGNYAIFNATGSLPTGFLTNDNNIFVECYIWDENWGRQTLLDVRTNNSYSRNLSNGIWQNWKQISML